MSAGCAEKLPLNPVSIILTMDAFLFQDRILYLFLFFYLCEAFEVSITVVSYEIGCSSLSWGKSNLYQWTTLPVSCSN